jgi:hypothetical protein
VCAPPGKPLIINIINKVNIVMRCPVCRAENEEATCRRCKADLSLLFELEEARRHALAEAARAAAAGDGLRTLEHANEAHRLRIDADSWRWLSIGYLLQRDFAQAIASRQHVRDET